MAIGSAGIAAGAGAWVGVGAGTVPGAGAAAGGGVALWAGSGVAVCAAAASETQHKAHDKADTEARQSHADIPFLHPIRTLSFAPLLSPASANAHLTPMIFAGDFSAY